MPVNKKRRKATEVQAAAGQKNLAEFQKTVRFKTQNVTHGIKSKHAKRQYNDLRFAKAKKLKLVMDNIITDLGGPEALNAGQEIVLATLRSKMIVLLQISEFLDSKDSVFGTDEELLPVLKNNFLAYSAAVRKSLESLYSMTTQKSSVPRIEDIIQKSK